MEPKESQPPSFYGISASQRCVDGLKKAGRVREPKIRRLQVCIANQLRFAVNSVN